MAIKKICNMNEEKEPLSLIDMPEPTPVGKEILIKILACGVCHTELDEIEGRTPPPFFPVIPGHQIVGYVVEKGAKAINFSIGDRVGIGWINSACGNCKQCSEGNENLCESFKATGRDVHGGYAQYVTILEDFAYRIPDNLLEIETAPLLCAGAIGYRSLRLTLLENGQNLGLFGFGASAHIVLKVVLNKYPSTKIFVFARSEAERSFAYKIGAFWCGDIDSICPEKLDAAIDTTPVWKPILFALKNLKGGGRLVINAIRKEEIDKEVLSTVNYPEHLWLEKEIKTVANVTRKDISEFLQLASHIKLKPEIQLYSLKEANKALVELKEKKIRGAKVLVIE